MLPNSAGGFYVSCSPTAELLKSFKNLSDDKIEKKKKTYFQPK